MVRNQQLGTPFHGLVYYRQGGVHCEHHPGHGCGRVACHQTHFIPVFGQGLGPEFLDGEQDLAQGGGSRGFRLSAVPGAGAVACPHL